MSRQKTTEKFASRETECPVTTVYTQGIQLFRERLSTKVPATIPKGIVGGF